MAQAFPAQGVAANVPPAEMSEQTFCDAVCKRFGIAREQYEEEVFRRCVFPATRFLSRLFRCLRPRAFEDDFELIRSVASCTSVREMRAEVNWFRSACPPRGFGRRVLHMRVSGKRLVGLAAQVFGH